MGPEQHLVRGWVRCSITIPAGTPTNRTAASRDRTAGPRSPHVTSQRSEADSHRAADPSWSDVTAKMVSAGRSAIFLHPDLDLQVLTCCGPGARFPAQGAPPRNASVAASTSLRARRMALAALVLLTFANP